MEDHKKKVKGIFYKIELVYDDRSLYIYSAMTVYKLQRQKIKEGPKSRTTIATGAITKFAILRAVTQ